MAAAAGLAIAPVRGSTSTQVEVQSFTIDLNTPVPESCNIKEETHGGFKAVWATLRYSDGTERKFILCV